MGEANTEETTTKQPHDHVHIAWGIMCNSLFTKKDEVCSVGYVTDIRQRRSKTCVFCRRKSLPVGNGDNIKL